MNIEIDVPDNTLGNVKVETFEVPENDFSQIISMIKYRRRVLAGKYCKKECLRIKRQGR
jgi:hypothetical protein